MSALPERSFEAVDDGEVVRQFEVELRQRGIIPPPHINPDGKLHRCDAEGRGGKNDACYVIHLDGFPAGGFQNHRDGLGWQNWKADLGRSPTPAERDELRQKAEADRPEREADEAQRRIEAAARAEAIWQQSVLCQTHPYLVRKGVGAHGVRLSRGNLVVPVRDSDGKVHSLQFIGNDGRKKYLSGGRIRSGYHAIGAPGDVICIAEGFATGASIHEATGYAVAVAFDAGNVKPVAESIRTKFPNIRVVVAADDDYLTVGNPGLGKAREAAAAVRGVVAVPVFGAHRPSKATDFNDLAQLAGADEVRRCIEEALAKAPIVTFGAIETSAEWPRPDLAAARQNRRPPPSLPLDVFGSMWSELIITAAEGASCPVDYVAGPLIASAALLIGNARWVSPWQGWKEPPVLWLGVVGDPSAGKSPGADPVVDILRSLENELANSFEVTHREWATARESARCLKEAWAKDVATAAKSGTPAPIMPANAVEPPEPVRPRIVVSDATPEALGGLLAAHEKGLLFFRDELAGWFSSFGRYSGSGADRAFWVEGYGGRAFTIDRVKHPLPVIIPRLSLGVLGGVQPDRLCELINGPDDGLQARFLWLWPDKVAPRRPTRHANVELGRAALRKLIELPLVPGDDGAFRPFLCPLADDAAETFDQWRKEHSEVEVSGVLASSFGKSPGHLLRLALILEHLWWCAKMSPSMPPSRISNAAVLAAAALVDDYFKPMAERVFGDAVLPEADRLAATLARWILRERPTVVNARALRRKARLPGLREAEKVKVALNALVEADWLRPVFSRSGDNAGRPREDYQVNPRLFEAGHAK